MRHRPPLLNFTTSEDLYCRVKLLQTNRTELRGSTRDRVCLRSAERGLRLFRCDPPATSSGGDVAVGTGFRYLRSRQIGVAAPG